MSNIERRRGDDSELAVPEDNRLEHFAEDISDEDAGGQSRNGIPEGFHEVEGLRSDNVHPSTGKPRVFPTNVSAETVSDAAVGEKLAQFGKNNSRLSCKAKNTTTGKTVSAHGEQAGRFVTYHGDTEPTPICERHFKSLMTKNPEVVQSHGWIRPADRGAHRASRRNSMLTNSLREENAITSVGGTAIPTRIIGRPTRGEAKVRSELGQQDANIDPEKLSHAHASLLSSLDPESSSGFDSDLYLRHTAARGLTRAEAGDLLRPAIQRHKELTKSTSVLPPPLSKEEQAREDYNKTYGTPVLEKVSGTTANPEIIKHATTLGVSPDADEDTIKGAYRELAKKHHPDIIMSREGRPATAEENKHFDNLTAAYEGLKKAKNFGGGMITRVKEFNTGRSQDDEHKDIENLMQPDF